MTKKAKKRAPKELTRKQLSRMERERRIEHWLILGVIVVAVAVVGVLAYGFIVENVVKAREPVAVVDGTPIRTTEFKARVRFVRLQMQNELLFWREQQQALDPTDPNSEVYLEYIQGTIRDLESQLAVGNSLAIGEQTLNQLIEEQLVRQEAARRGIAVSPEELQETVEQNFGYERNPATPTSEPLVPEPLATTELSTPSPEPAATAGSEEVPTAVATPAPTSTPEPTPTPMTEEAFRQRYNDFLQSLKELKISEQQFRSWVEGSLLVSKLQEQFKAEVPTTADQVQLRYMSVSSQEQADQLAGRLQAGEDFQTVVDEIRQDESNPGYGGDLGWLPKSMVESRWGTELADLAFTLGVGKRSQPVASQDGSQYIIVEVVGHEERALDEALRESVGEDAFQKWLDAQEVVVERKMYQDRIPLEP